MCKKAFTLVELLVVIAIIAVLLAIMVPALAIVKERSRRVLCANNVRQFMLVTTLYARDNKEKLPSGASDMPKIGINAGTDEHTPVMARTMLVRLIEISRTPKVFRCPWLQKPWSDSKDPNGWYYSGSGGYGYILGYNYLGGHSGTPWPVLTPAQAKWMSPQTTLDKGSMELVVELNAWTPGDSMTFAPHGKRGPILKGGSDSANKGICVPPEKIGAVGGNIGLMDGSVRWKKITEMKKYQTSSPTHAGGCFGEW